MGNIINKWQLSEEVYVIEVSAPEIARERKAGQFVIVQLDDDFGERIPLTIANADANKGTIKLLFQTVGATTHKLGELGVGDSVAVLGPLGNPTDIRNFGWAVCVGGGIGLAPLFPIAEALRRAGNKVTVIAGARNKDLLVMQEELAAVAHELIVVTDDGSAGVKGLVTEPLAKLCAAEPKPDVVVAIGPTIMMRFCAETTRPFGVHTMVSLNTIMVDGTGMCGGCRVRVGDETKFVCVDGPEFDGHKVDWASMMLRQKSFKRHEDAAHQKCHGEIERAKIAGAL